MTRSRGLWLAMAVAALPLAAAAAEDPTAILRRTIDSVIAVLQDPALGHEGKLERITAIAEERFDFDRMSRLVLARNWKKLSEEQRGEFLVEFKRHMTLTYGRSIDQFAGEKVEVGESRIESNGDATVGTRIVGGAADDTRIDYRMRMRDGEWRVIDVIVERVSLVSNFRSQIQEIVTQQGPDRLVEILRTKNEGANAQKS